MTKSDAKKHSGTIVEESIAAFGFKKNMKTDPKIMRSVFEELELYDFKSGDLQMQKILKDIVSKPQKLQPIFDNIKMGLVLKHPAIIEFAELALKKNWFKASERITRSLHVLYILEILTAGMCNKHSFFVEVQDHYKAKERKCGLDTIHIFSTILHAFGISRNIFIIAKAYTLDPLMIYFRIQGGLGKSRLSESNLKKLYKNKKINYFEYKLLSPVAKNAPKRINELLRINIYEAGISDYEKGFKTNAICAYELSEDIKKYPPRARFEKKSVVPEKNPDIFYKSISDKENKFPVVSFSQDWVSLYTTWNMAFVLGDLNNLDIIFPKLLIPSIINAKSENFLGLRLVSLWLTINHDIFRRYKKIEIEGPNNRTEMAKAWSEINKKYAFKLAKRETHEGSKTLKRNYRRFFSHSFRNLFRLVRAFLLG